MGTITAWLAAAMLVLGGHGQGAKLQRGPVPDVRGTQGAPLVVKLTPAERSKADSVAEAQHADNESRTANATVALERMTGALAFGTIVLAFFTFSLWRTTNDLVTGGERTAARQLRAYLGVESMHVLSQTETDPLTYEVEISNYGQTPAFHVSVSMNYRVLPFPLRDSRDLAEEPDADETQFRLPPTHISVHAGRTRRITSSRHNPRLPEQCIADFKAGKNAAGEQIQLYCYGTIRYTDLFGTEHWAHYCRSFGGDYYQRLRRGSLCHLYNDSSDDPKSGRPVPADRPGGVHERSVLCTSLDSRAGLG